MFLLHTLFSMGVIYWISALIADTIMTSDEELALAPAIRVGFGFLFTLIYFSAAWLIISIQQAWVLGILLISCYAFSNIELSLSYNLVRIKLFWKRYVKTFLYFLLGSLLFFSPLLLSNNYGPFTEGGGDISIYADTAKYLYDAHQTARGLPTKNVDHFIFNIKNSLTSITVEKKQQIQYDQSLINPPNAEFAVYRVILSHVIPFFYAPYAIYSFLSGKTNYSVYFAIQAFFYLCMLAGIWYFFRQYGARFSLIALLLIASSYSIVSVFYNMYSMQAISLASSALIIAILPTTKLLSRAGFRTYGSALLTIWLSYIHYLSVVAPLIFFSTLLFQKKIKNESAKTKNSLLQIISVGIFIALWVFVTLAGSAQPLIFAKSLLFGTFAPTKHWFLGESLPIFSFEWFSFLFGFLSQQHFQPYATESPVINYIIGFGIVAGFITLINGLVIMFQLYRPKDEIIKETKSYYCVYGIIIITTILQFYLANSSLYTQAKGAQNVLVYFYLLFLLPLVLGNIALKKGINVRKTVLCFNIVFSLFIISLVIPRVAYTFKLAFNYDRSAILESSFFSEAEKIRKLDTQAFVLFEPRKSADLYISGQPFFGAKMVPTRYLVLQNVIIQPDNRWLTQKVLGSDLINLGNLAHVWQLKSECKVTSNILGITSCVWHKEKLLDRHEPALLLFGDDYQRNFGERSISNDARDTKNIGLFSYIRNGSAMLFIPVGEKKQVEVLMESRDETQFTNMRNEILTRFNQGEFGKQVTVSTQGRFVKLLYQLPKTALPSFILIAHYEGEYWLNVKLDKHEASLL